MDTYKRCGCNKNYTKQDWNLLKLIDERYSVDEDGTLFFTESRNCSCGSTISIETNEGKQTPTVYLSSLWEQVLTFGLAEDARNRVIEQCRELAARVDAITSDNDRDLVMIDMASVHTNILKAVADLRAGRAVLKKMHCKYGHLFSDENTFYYRTGARGCRACAKASRRKSYYRDVEASRAKSKKYTRVYKPHRNQSPEKRAAQAEWSRTYYYKNKDELLKKAKQYYQANREENLARAKLAYLNLSAAKKAQNVAKRKELRAKKRQK